MHLKGRKKAQDAYVLAGLALPFTHRSACIPGVLARFAAGVQKRFPSPPLDGGEGRRNPTRQPLSRQGIVMLSDEVMGKG